MNRLKILENMGFKITWKLIDIGLYGLYEIPVVLTRDEVWDYLDDLLTNIDEQSDNIISLICEKDDPIRADKILKKYTDNDKSDIIVQTRKWRAYLLKTLLDNISHDCLQGLLELIEFWISMGKPEDCPHIFPASKENVHDYFTQSTYRFLATKNRVWLNQEIAKIIELEKNLKGGLQCER